MPRGRERRPRRFWGDSANQGCPYANGADLTAKHQLNWIDVAYCRDGYVYTAPVGRLRPNGFGLYDMLGNVWEWVEDCWHDDYAGAPTEGNAWTSGGECFQRVPRGGSWYNVPRILRSANRRWNAPDFRNSDLGFRVARTLD
jgi:formylglycine-generating enzyme required for sulfatase activity